jgi:ABC-2 type transport system ATP-binding protein
MDEAAVFSQVTKTFGRREVVAPLSFSVGAGRTLGLLGPYGSGKTTVLHMLVGLLAPSSGHVELLGRSPSDAVVRRRLGVAPDDLPLPLSLTGREFLDLHRALRNGVGASLENELAELFELGDHLQRPVGDYSHGMKRKLQFVTACCHTPALLVLDEPNRGLDPEAAGVLREVMRYLAREHGTATVVATHDLNDAAEFCDEIVIIHDGHAIAAGSPACVAASAGTATLREAFLDLTGLGKKIEQTQARLVGALAT